MDDACCTCRGCGKRVSYMRTRLFWSTDPAHPGTFRLCMRCAAHRDRIAAGRDFAAASR